MIIQKISDYMDKCWFHLLSFIDKPGMYFKKLGSNLFVIYKEMTKSNQEQVKELITKIKDEAIVYKAELKKQESRYMPPPPPPSLIIKKGEGMSAKIKALHSSMERSISTDKLALLVAGISEVDPDVVEDVLKNRDISIKLTWKTGSQLLPEVDINIKN